MVRRGAFGLPSWRRPPGPSPSSTGRTDGGRFRGEHSAGLPGLGQHEGGLPLLLQRACERRRHSSRPFDATRRRFAASDGPILVLHDTTEFTYKRKRTEAVGFTTKVSSGKDKRGRERMHAVCGLLMHSSLAVTTDGLPLGIAAAKFWTRKRFKGTNALKRKINPTRVADRGQGEHALAGESPAIPPNCWAIPRAAFTSATAKATSGSCSAWPGRWTTHFVIRRFANRLAEDGSRTVEAIMTDEKVRGLHRVRRPRRQGQAWLHAG